MVKTVLFSGVMPCSSAETYQYYREKLLPPTLLYIKHSQQVPVYQTTRHHNPVSHKPYILHCKNLKYHTYNGDLI